MIDSKNFISDYVFPSKAKYIAEVADKLEYRQNTYFEEYNDAIVLPVVKILDDNVTYRRGGVVDSSGNYVELSQTKSRAVGKYAVKEYEFIDEKVVYCGFFYKSWGHFITEGVSRLWYALNNDESIDAYVFIVEKDEIQSFSGNYLEYLKLLGIADKVRIINKATKFRTIIVPEEGFALNNYYTELFVKMYEFINNKGLSLYSGPKFDNVFFSKRKCEISIMAHLNEKFVDDFFAKNGFKIFYPEQLSLIDTIGIIQNAKSLAGISSSLIHNQLFGHGNQTTICIEKDAFYNPYQIMIAKITKSKSVFIDACRSIFTVNNKGPFIFDYTVFLDNFVHDNGWIPSKPMSESKFKRIFKQYISRYFYFNSELPQDYLFDKDKLDMTREIYNDTVKGRKAFSLSFYERVAFKLKKLKLHYFM